MTPLGLLPCRQYRVGARPPCLSEPGSPLGPDVSVQVLVRCYQPFRNKSCSGSRLKVARCTARLPQQQFFRKCCKTTARATFFIKQHKHHYKTNVLQHGSLATQNISRIRREVRFLTLKGHCSRHSQRICMINSEKWSVMSALHDATIKTRIRALLFKRSEQKSACGPLRDRLRPVEGPFAAVEGPFAVR